MITPEKAAKRQFKIAYAMAREIGAMKYALSQLHLGQPGDIAAKPETLTAIAQYASDCIADPKKAPSIEEVAAILAKDVYEHR